jgi:hypothetical protein
VEKISIEEVINEDEIDYDVMIEEWAKYIASLCKDCGAEPSEPHCCGVRDE